MASGYPGAADPGLARFLTSLEGHFVAVRGRGVQWSPADCQHAAIWYRAGIPLGTVIDVVHTRARAWRFVHGDPASLPMHLGYYDAAVRRVAAPTALPMAAPQGAPTGSGAAGLGVAGGDARPPKELNGASQQKDDACLSALLDALPTLVDQAADSGLAAAYRAVGRRLDAALRGPPGAATKTLDSQLTACRRTLLRDVLDSLTPRRKAGIVARAEAELAPLAGRYGKRALNARRERLVERFLGADLQLRVPTAAGWHNPNTAA